MISTEQGIILLIAGAAGFAAWRWHDTTQELNRVKASFRAFIIEQEAIDQERERLRRRRARVAKDSATKPSTFDEIDTAEQDLTTTARMRLSDVKAAMAEAANTKAKD